MDRFPDSVLPRRGARKRRRQGGVWIENLSVRSRGRRELERRSHMTIVGILVVIILVLLVIYLIRRV
jgi:cobalamin biosynthesis Mg chelatase CobN